MAGHYFFVVTGTDSLGFRHRQSTDQEHRAREYLMRLRKGTIWRAHRGGRLGWRILEKKGY